jgi:hypothetical protein
MQKENFITLYTSLFSAKEKWNILLQEGIKEFYKRYEDLLSDCEVEFNYTCGENIRLHFSCEKEKAEIIAQNADRYFRIYFSQKGFEERNTTPPFDGLFLPFPSNTIQYGLYNKNERDPFLQNIGHTLSNILIDTLSDDIIDDESLLTLALYLQLGLICIVNLDNAYLDAQLKISLEDSDTVPFMKNYILNRNAYQEILSDVTTNWEQPIEGFKWLTNWMYMCSRLLDNIGNPEWVFHTISSQINKQLGFNKASQAIVSFLICQLKKEKVSKCL